VSTVHIRHKRESSFDFLLTPNNFCLSVMAAKAQVLTLEPSNEISFKGPFTEVVTSNLRLSNPTDRPIFFKVKTTAPRFYCVRPNSGLVKPNETAFIAVMLQPVDNPGTLESERTRHKFMIQTAYAPNTDTPVDTFWKSADASQVMDSKLKVVFVNNTAEPNAEDSQKSPPTAMPPSPVQQNSKNESFSNANENASGGQNAQIQALQSRLKNEMELRKRVEDDKANLERENREVRMRLANKEGDAQLGVQLPTWTIFLISLATLLIGLILGKLF
jgi:hypothetical protein